MTRANREALKDQGVRIPSLDGLRAMSILLVLVGHSVITWTRGSGSRVPVVDQWGAVGVNVFFSISGFLITTLLLRELSSSGQISLRAFYVRRAFRILPALWAFLLASAFFAPPMGAAAYAKSLLFLVDYLPASRWWLGHIWSLSVEEKFYLLWPATLVLLGPKRGLRLASLIILAGPAFRVACYFLLPALRGDVAFNFHTNVDPILLGCVVALLRDSRPEHRLLAVLRSPWVAAASIPVLLVVMPLLSERWPGPVAVIALPTVRAIGASSFVVWCLAGTGGPVRAVLNWWPVARVGLISYSLYLWQQPMFDPALALPGWMGAVTAIAGAFVAAELSYRLVEQPALALRTRLGSTTRRRAAVLTEPGEGS